jgi:hypothetical protein
VQFHPQQGVLSFQTQNVQQVQQYGEFQQKPGATTGSNAARNKYSLRPILLFINTDVFRHILFVDTSVLAKSNMGRRKYRKKKNVTPGVYGHVASAQLVT